MKRILPHKLVVAFDKDGAITSSLLQYKIDVDGKVENKFYTMSVKAGIDLGSLNSISTDAKIHVESGEKIDEANAAEVKLQQDLTELAQLREDVK